MTRISLFFLILGISLGFLPQLQSQQLHFSQFFLSPATTNPGQLGLFEGTARIGGLHRSQWLNTQEAGTNTTALYIDSPITTGLRKKDWVGLGVGLTNDVAGIGLINNIDVNIGLSYHLSLNKDQSSVLSLGAQYTNSSINIDDSQLEWKDGIQSGGFSQDAQLLNAQSSNYGDWSAGLNWRQVINDRMKIELGYALYHINEPEASFFNLPDTISAPTVPRKSIISGRFNINVSEKLNLEPLFLIQSIPSENEMLIGLNGYSPIGQKSSVLQYGAAYRLQDAIVFYLGLMDHNFRLGLSYDFTVSELSNYNPINFELGGYYIIKKYKRPEVNPFIFCPRF